MTKEFDEKNMAKSRAMCEAMAEAANTGKRVLSEREKLILDMWPKFEDGEYVMLGDGFMGCGGVSDVVELLDFEDDNVRLWGESGCDIDLGLKPVIKRPVQSVLDADGVEIKVGDTVWFQGNPLPYAVVEVKDGSVRLHSKTYCSEESATTVWTDILTHIAPDSWERLEEDAEFNDETGIVGGNLDIVRRAKALAGVEVDE